MIHLPLRADRHRNRTRIPRKRLRIESRRWTWRSPCLWSFSSWRLEWTKRQASACRIEWRWSRPYPPTKRRLAFGIQWWIVTRVVGAYCKRQGHIEYSDRSRLITSSSLGPSKTKCLKLGQQTLSVGTILAYLETEYKIWTLSAHIIQTIFISIFSICFLIELKFCEV